MTRYTRFDIPLAYWDRQPVPAHTVYLSQPWIPSAHSSVTQECAHVSKINDKLGLKPAGKRSMMKLPDDCALRNKVTAARCPSCASVGAYLSKVKGREGWAVCSWCHHTWELPE